MTPMKSLAIELCLDPPADTEGTPMTPTCIHGLGIGEADPDCADCAALIVEQHQRDEWLDGLQRLLTFFADHRDLIPARGGAYVRCHPYLSIDAERQMVLDLKAATPIVLRDTHFTSADVSTTEFDPHRFTLQVRAEAVGAMTEQTTTAWVADVSIFGAPA